MTDFAPFIRLWDLVADGEPILTPLGGVQFARRDDQAVAVKLIPPAADEARSAAVLRHWGAERAVLVLDEAPGALLLERISPGNELKALSLDARDAEALEVFCQVAAALHARSAPPGAFPSLADWAQVFDRRADQALALGVSSDLIVGARRRFDRLWKTSDAPILLHGDLHHGNILRDARRGWLAIDPKGVLGEAAYEPAAFLTNPWERPDLWSTPQALLAQARAISERLDLDPARVIGWTQVKAVFAILWLIEDGLDHRPGLSMAEAAARAADFLSPG